MDTRLSTGLLQQLPPKLPLRSCCCWRLYAVDPRHPLTLYSAEINAIQTPADKRGNSGRTSFPSIGHDNSPAPQAQIRLNRSDF